EQALYSTNSEVEAVIKDLNEVNETVASITGDLSDTVNKLSTFATNEEESVNLAAETCPIRLKIITDRVPKAMQNTFRASRALKYSPVMFHNKKQHALHCSNRMLGISLTLQKEFGRFLVNIPPTDDNDDLEQLRTHLNLSLDALNVILYALDDGMTKLCALNVLATGEVSQEERSVMNVSEDLNVQPEGEEIFLHPEQALYSTNSEVEAVIKDLNEVNETVPSITGDLSDTVNKLLTFAINEEEPVNLAAETCPIRLKEITDGVPNALQNTFRASRALKYSPVMFYNKNQHALHCSKIMLGISLTLQKEFGRFLVNIPPTDDDDDLEQLRTHLNLSLDTLNVILYALDDGMTKLCALNVIATGEVSQEERSVMNVSEDLNVQPEGEEIFLHPGKHRSNSVRNRFERMNSPKVSIVFLIIIVLVTLVFIVVLVEKEIELEYIKSSLHDTS
ncbi:hypothetical protein C0J52_27283, partial [Blattella germanica]